MPAPLGMSVAPTGSVAIRRLPAFRAAVPRRAAMFRMNIRFCICAPTSRRMDTRRLGRAPEVIYCEVLGSGSKPAANKDPRQFRTLDVLVNRRDDVGIDVAHRGDQPDGKPATKESHREPVRVGVDRKATQDLIPDHDDARLRHAPHNDRECPDPLTNAARALRPSRGASFPWEKASRSRFSMKPRRPDGKPRGRRCSTSSMKPQVYLSAS